MRKNDKLMKLYKKMKGLIIIENLKYRYVVI